MGLGAFVIRRVLLMIPTLIGVTLLIFAVMQLFSPTQRASLFITEASKFNKRSIEETIIKYHLNSSVIYQYSDWVTSLLGGNLGWSEKSTPPAPVATAIMNNAPATAEIVLYAAPIIVLLGVFLGVQSAVHKDKMLDHATRTLSIVGYSLPSFLLGIISLAIFFTWLGWFPPGRLSSPAQVAVYSSSSNFVRYTGLATIDGVLNGQLWVTIDAFKHLVLPVAVISIINIAAIVRVMRSSMLESLNKAYIIMAKSKGLEPREVINIHARRNALIPVVTLSGMMIASMLNGLIITETVFAFNGVGQWAATAAINLDMPAVLGFALFSGIIFIVANLIVDILYAYIDPRIRLG